MPDFRILVPKPEIKPMTLSVNMQGPNHWTTRARAEAGAASGSAGMWRVDPLATPVE